MAVEETQQKSKITAQVDDRTKHRLNEIAHELSVPGRRVTLSMVVREAITDYVEKHESDPEACKPSERGGLGVELEEGAA